MRFAWFAFPPTFFFFPFGFVFIPFVFRFGFKIRGICSDARISARTEIELFLLLDSPTFWNTFFSFSFFRHGFFNASSIGMGKT